MLTLIAVTPRIREHVDTLIRLEHDLESELETDEEISSVTIKAKSDPRIEESATLIGTLETLTVHGDKPAFYIFDSLTGEKIVCYFPEDRLEEAKAALPRRVSVIGKARL